MCSERHLRKWQQALPTQPPTKAADPCIASGFLRLFQTIRIAQKINTGIAVWAIWIIASLAIPGYASSQPLCEEVARKSFLAAKRMFQQHPTPGGILVDEVSIAVTPLCSPRGPVLDISVRNTGSRLVRFQRVSLPWNPDHPSIEIAAERRGIRVVHWVSSGFSDDLLSLGPGETLTGTLPLWDRIEIESVSDPGDQEAVGFVWNVGDFHRGRFELDLQACPLR